MKPLQVFLMPDLHSWEMAWFGVAARTWWPEVPNRLVRVNAQDKGRLRRPHSESSWVVTRDWKASLRFLTGNAVPQSPVYISVFGWKMESRIFPLLLWKAEALPENVHIVTHSPLDYRVFLEMHQFPRERVHYLPLPLSLGQGQLSEANNTREAESLCVGTLAPFVAEENLAYAMNVAHYVTARHPQISFKIFGHGPLYDHLNSIIRELKLNNKVEVVEWSDPAQLAALDVFMYAPLRSHQFLPLFWAGENRLPTLAAEVLGVEEYIQDGHTGFVVPINDTRSMGELILRVVEDRVLRQSLGNGLRRGLSERVSFQCLRPEYEKLFSSGESKPLLLGNAA